MKTKAIAFYLPQFHRIPENDRWWGEGFTEWTNVRRAQPLFEGHYQPRLPQPEPLGYYDLGDEGVLERQAEIATAHGIHGFCFYYYWFSGGKRLLDMPLLRMLESGSPSFPFCLCWANESWSRRWDGSDHEILMPQEYAPEDVPAFAESVVPFLNDRRYIRIDGRPLLLVYRARDIPEIEAAVAAWRRIWRERGVGEVFLCAALTFDENNPLQLGFDAGVEFPPHNHNARSLSGAAVGIEVPETFRGHLFDYTDLANHYLATTYRFPVFRSVTMAWDNTPRRGATGSAILNCNPSLYGYWLRRIARTNDPAPSANDRLLFINAWNEWGEGAYLEPDQRNGFAFLEETKRSLENIADPGLNHAGVRLSDDEFARIKSWALNLSDDQVNLIRDLSAQLRAANARHLHQRSQKEKFKASAACLRAEQERLHQLWAWRFARHLVRIERSLRKRLSAKKGEDATGANGGNADGPQAR